MLANDGVARPNKKSLPKLKKWDKKLHLWLFQQYRQTGNKEFLDIICQDYMSLVINLAKRFVRFNQHQGLIAKTCTYS